MSEPLTGKQIPPKLGPLLRALALGSALGVAVGSGQAQALSAPVQAEAPSHAEFSVQLPTSDQVSPRVSALMSLSPADAKAGSTVTLSAAVVIQDGWHIAGMGAAEGVPNALPTTLDFKAEGLTPIGDAFVPSVAPKAVKVGDTTLFEHSGTVVWKREYRVNVDADEYSGEGSFRFQVCDEEKCLPPKTLTFRLGGGPPKGAQAPATTRLRYKLIGEPMVVPLKVTALERALLNPMALITADPNKEMELYVEQLMSSMDQKTVLSLGGRVELGEEAFMVYVADQDDYPLVNTSTDETRFGNTSTFVSIDHNGDGAIADYESVATNWPIRIGDSMFLVTEISKESMSLTLQGVDTPLAGAVLNRKCPEFWYETVDGHVVSNRSILGTVTILDVWAVT